MANNNKTYNQIQKIPYGVCEIWFYPIINVNIPQNNNDASISNTQWNIYVSETVNHSILDYNQALKVLEDFMADETAKSAVSAQLTAIIASFISREKEKLKTQKTLARLPKSVI